MRVRNILLSTHLSYAFSEIIMNLRFLDVKRSWFSFLVDGFFLVSLSMNYIIMAGAIF